MKRTAICPGTFDPITNGHLDLVERGLRIFDEVVIAVAHNPAKKPLFDVKERIKMIKEAVRGNRNVTVEYFDGLLMDYARKKNAVAIIRGLRAVSDFEYELQMAHMNRRLNAQVETVFMMPSEEFSFITSTMVKEVASFGGSVKGLVPLNVEKALNKKSFR